MANAAAGIGTHHQRRTAAGPAILSKATTPNTHVSKPPISNTWAASESWLPKVVSKFVGRAASREVQIARALNRHNPPTPLASNMGAMRGSNGTGANSSHSTHAAATSVLPTNSAV